MTLVRSRVNGIRRLYRSGFSISLGLAGQDQSEVNPYGITAGAGVPRGKGSPCFWAAVSPESIQQPYAVALSLAAIHRCDGDRDGPDSRSRRTASLRSLWSFGSSLRALRSRWRAWCRRASPAVYPPDAPIVAVRQVGTIEFRSSVDLKLTECSAVV